MSRVHLVSILKSVHQLLFENIYNIKHQQLVLIKTLKHKHLSHLFGTKALKTNQSSETLNLVVAYFIIKLEMFKSSFSGASTEIKEFVYVTSRVVSRSSSCSAPSTFVCQHRERRDVSVVKSAWPSSAPLTSPFE